jgi:hypothetical protein
VLSYGYRICIEHIMVLYCLFHGAESNRISSLKGWWPTYGPLWVIRPSMFLAISSFMPYYESIQAVWSIRQQLSSAATAAPSLAKPRPEGRRRGGG